MAKKSLKQINAERPVGVARVKKRQAAPGRKFEKGNTFGFKSKKALNGQVDPKINVGGRPKSKLLSDAYREWLAIEDKNGITNAQYIAASQGNRAIWGFTDAAREIRSATEGEETQSDNELYKLYVQKLTEFLQQQVNANANENDFAHTIDVTVTNVESNFPESNQLEPARRA